MRQKLFGLGGFVDSDLIDSLQIELLGSYLWMGGSILFSDVVNEVVPVKKKKKGGRNMNKNVKKMIVGMFVVASAFGKKSHIISVNE